MRDCRASSPTLSCSSADEALFELLGVDKLSLDQEESDEDYVEQPMRATVSSLTPPSSCHRLHTPHEPLLLVCPALSIPQCRFIVEKGYKATNDGGAHYGPQYIKQAALSSSESSNAVVTLEKPNHHKVVVFMDDMISTWLNQAIKQYFDSYIQKWNISHDKHYIINPRLRLLRYDAIDDDVFLSHYDATTTTTKQGVEYESKLTILVYLNTDFGGGETCFINSFNPCDYIDIQPTMGKIVVFNHELYHASRELIFSDEIIVDGVKGGSKFVLRSDVMFEINDKDNDPCAAASTPCLLEMPTSETEHVKVNDVVRHMQTTNTCLLEQVLQELDCLHASVSSFLVPGRGNLTKMLVDLGLEKEECEAFLVQCEAAMERVK